MFEVPQSKADAPENRFEFTIDGEKHSVPLMRFLPGSVVELMAAAEDKESYIHLRAAQYAMFGPVGSPAGDAVRTLDAERFEALLEAYQEASGVTVGESSASADS